MISTVRIALGFLCLSALTFRTNLAVDRGVPVLMWSNDGYVLGGGDYCGAGLWVRSLFPKANSSKWNCHYIPKIYFLSEAALFCKSEFRNSF